MATLKEWNKDDRPREKLLIKGTSALSDAELIAILFHSGTRNQTALDLAQYVLSLAGNNLAKLGKLDIKQLRAVKGVGLAKGVCLLAALELGRRRAGSWSEESLQIHNAMDVQKIMGTMLSDLPHEEFWALALDQANHLIDKKKITSGGLSGVSVDFRILFGFAIEKHATRLILVHNHPSGECTPSIEDRKLTKKAQHSGDLLYITIVDHIIIGRNKYFSFKEEKLL